MTSVPRCVLNGQDEIMWPWPLGAFFFHNTNAIWLNFITEIECKFSHDEKCHSSDHLNHHHLTTSCWVTSDHLQQTTRTFHTSYRILKYFTHFKQVQHLCRAAQTWNSTSEIAGCFLCVLSHCLAFPCQKKLCTSTGMSMFWEFHTSP